MSPTLLYLDTARLGRMTPRAQQAHVEFVRLAGAEGGSLFFEQFLRRGSDSWPEEFRQRFSGLAGWRGVGALKALLRQLVGSEPDLPVLIANRSTQLMKLAARLLFHTCLNVLVTDLGWQPYHDILSSEARRAGRALTVVAVQQAVLHSGASEDDVVRVIRDRFVSAGCDGLFLTAVSHLGVRLPVVRLVRELEAVRAVRFVVVDGAQDFCHVSADLRDDFCDLYLAGCHKWLGAYYPLGLGFYGRRRSRGMIEAIRTHLLASGELDDPLLRFAPELETGQPGPLMETVNLAPLFSCQGAVEEALPSRGEPEVCLPRRLDNLSVAVEAVLDCGWRPLLPSTGLRTGILLLQAAGTAVQRVPAGALRQAFAEHGVALTAYDEGLIRLSMPATSWPAGVIEHLRSTLRLVA